MDWIGTGRLYDPHLPPPVNDYIAGRLFYFYLCVAKVILVYGR